MRLKEIKLAGFKSFVDVTSIVFPNEMTAIVGPNGCGKSNTIDAVRWVMGESSAKQLRGENMSDVIFNGSQLRKPVSVCSVELVFDNSDFSIQGAFSGFSEVSVKRKLSRDGQNHYYLNGTLCRRKDVTDLFLGTGLGPRSYAIIEQGMISTLIESKPEELRVFIEEAAGISRYKARRKESEMHIQRTLDNVVRLEDVRTELQRQISKLQTQAATAEQYKALKSRVRELTASVGAMQWHTLEQRIQQHTLIAHSLSVEQDKQQMEHARISQALLHLDIEQAELTDSINHQQHRQYKRGNELAGLEQSLKFEQEKVHTRTQQHKQWQQTLTTLNAEALEVSAEINAHKAQVLQESGQGEPLQLRLKSLEKALAELEQRQVACQLCWDEANETAQTYHIEQAKRQQQIQQLTQTIDSENTQYTQQLALLKNIEIPSDIASITPEPHSIDASFQQTLNKIVANIAKKQADIRQASEQCEEHQASLKALETQHELLAQTLSHQQKTYDRQTLKLSMLHKEESLNEEQLSNFALQGCADLAQSIHSVSTEWQLAVSGILHAYLGAKIFNLHGLPQLAEPLTKHTGKLTLLFEAQKSDVVLHPQSLLHHVKSAMDLTWLLADVICCDNVFSYDLASLGKQQSVIDRHGRWANAYCFKQLTSTQASAPDDSVWQIRQQLEALHAEITQLESQKTVLINRMTDITGMIDTLEQFIDSAQVQCQQWQFDQQKWQQKIDHAEEKVAQYLNVVALQQQQKTRQAEHIQQIKQQMTQLRHSIDAHTSTCALLEKTQGERQAAFLENNEKEALAAEKESLQGELKDTRTALQTTQTHYHQWQLQGQALNHQLHHLQEKQAEIEKEKVALAEKLLSAQQQDDSKNNIAEYTQTIEQLTAVQFASDKALAENRAALVTLSETEKHYKQQQSDIATQLNRLDNRREKNAVQQSGQENEQAHWLAQVKNEGFVLADLLAQCLDEHATQSNASIIAGFNADLNRVKREIEALGAINLIAIEELALSLERKSYLDQQFEELNQAVDTLQGAIERIDYETQTRFKQTFQLVNQGLAELFPKVFGGGSAWLETNSDDWLSTGISLMARPPGKKNSSIHLLSGGEKALTAIALVFSIFRLNPAPFCLLDEVDAPLDDSNVERYAKLVHAMSDNVQFIYITHNKIAMEKAQDLMGVTMNEPGVSKLVSVSLQEAQSYVEDIKT